eukprot:GHVU01123300.1.p1 GENE.GHVU01123300.1~~GHVU01123300.1.p1  ORF type:complete len:364 (+),score=44.16 GHVU01123300.1:177-1268(+)
MEPSAPNLDETLQGGVDMIHETAAQEDVHCNSCEISLSNSVRIICLQCTHENDTFDLCVNCFSSGKVVQNHKTSHRHTFCARRTFPLFDKNWTAREEWLLLQGMRNSGFNWEEVADEVGERQKARLSGEASSDARKTSRDCENHYYETYTSSPEQLLPDFSLLSRHHPAGEGAGWELPVELKERAASVSRDEDPVVEDELTRRYREWQRKKEEEDSYVHTSQSPRKRARCTPSQAFEGHMPMRGDFDREHEDAAELRIADLECDPLNDCVGEVEQTLQALAVYCGQLDERAQRKQVLVDKSGGVNGTRASRKGRVSGQEKDVADRYMRLKPIFRFGHPDDESFANVTSSTQINDEWQNLLTEY